MITLTDDMFTGPDVSQEMRVIRLARWDDGTVYNSFVREGGQPSVQATILCAVDPSQIHVESVGFPEDEVRIVIPTALHSGSRRSPDVDALGDAIRGFIRRGESWIPAAVRISSLSRELSSRWAGLLETNVFADKAVFIPGQGSGGAAITIELAKQGVGELWLMDHDRYEVANNGRHYLGLPHDGRFKVDAMADAVRDKNPFVRIRTSRSKISNDTVEEVRDYVRGADLVIGAIDEPAGRKLLNKICVQERKPLILAGVFRRAYGGQILRVLPHRSPCYQCFLMNLPAAVRDQEISSLRDALRIAYSDRAVPVEPGLSNDIAPVSTMVVTLAIQLLLNDRPTTLRNRDEDLSAPWYLWLNRREPGTDYERLDPMEFNVDGMHILRWYGIAMARRTDCPCCGNFVGERAREAGLTVTPEDTDAFKCA